MCLARWLCRVRVWSQVSGACAPAVAGYEIAAELKGVSEALPVRHVWPATLAGRQHTPLAGRAEVHIDKSDVVSLPSRRSRCSSVGVHLSTHTHATVGVTSLEVVTNSTGASRISSCLEAAVPLLQQSHGTLVSLLGEHLVTGWNLTQPVPLHAENAVQFVRRVLRVPLCERLTAGLASGTVYHGDVGTRSQRFLTVAGPALTTSLHVWRTACDAGQRFLYTPGEGAVVGAVQDVLVESTLVPQNTAAFPGTTLYELRQEQRAGYSKVQLG